MKTPPTSETPQSAVALHSEVGANVCPGCGSHGIKYQDGWWCQNVFCNVRSFKSRMPPVSLFGDDTRDDAADTNKPWSQQVCDRIAELERKVELGGQLAATIVINIERGTIKSGDDETLLIMSNRLLDRSAKEIPITPDQQQPK